MSDEREDGIDPTTDDGRSGGSPSAEDRPVAGQARRALGPRDRAAGSHPIQPVGVPDSIDSNPTGDGDLMDPVDGDPVDGLTDPDPEDLETAGVGAGSAAAGSARAAARRTVRSGVSSTKGVATRPRDVAAAPSAGPLSRLRRFLLEVVAELRKVIWPGRNQMVTYTIVVIVFVVFMVALVAGLDVLFARSVLAIFG